MKKFKVNFGIQRIDVNFDGIYTMSEFYKFPEVNNIPNIIIINPEDFYDENTREVCYSKNYVEIRNKWNNWLSSIEGKRWLSSILPNYDKYDWMVDVEPEEIKKRDRLNPISFSSFLYHLKSL